MSGELGGRYPFEARFFLAGDKLAAQQRIGAARIMLGHLSDMCAHGGVEFQTITKVFPDGTQIKAVKHGALFQAQIFVPPGGAEKPLDLTYFYVRPKWGAAYDWGVDALTSGAVVVREVEPKEYSNRIWTAADGTIYCIVGGSRLLDYSLCDRDSSKYFGPAGAKVTADGQVIHTFDPASPGYGICGAGVFAGRIVVLHSHVYPADSGGGYGHVLFEEMSLSVLVDGVSVADIGPFSSYLDGALPTTGFQRRKIPQHIFAFSPDGAEAAAVISNSVVLKLKFELVGSAVTASYTFEHIPGTSKSPPGVYPFPSVPPGDPSAPSDAETALAVALNAIPAATADYYFWGEVHATSYAVALACDYIGGDLVYCLCDVVVDNALIGATTGVYDDTSTLRLSNGTLLVAGLGQHSDTVAGTGWAARCNLYSLDIKNLMVFYLRSVTTAGVTVQTYEVALRGSTVVVRSETL